MKSIIIPDSVTSIGRNAFYGCSALQQVYFNGDISTWLKIDFADFYSNPMFNTDEFYVNGELMTEAVIPDGVTEIGDYAFRGYSGLTNVTLGNSVTSIGEYAFSGCTGLKSIIISDSITSIGRNAFDGCSALQQVYFNGDISAWLKINFRGGYSNPLYYTDEFYMDGKLVSEIVIPNGVTSIGNSAFYGYSDLTSVTIPDSVTSIAYSAFQGCYKLIEVINYSHLDLTVGSSLNGYVAYYAKNVHTGDSMVINIDDYLFYTQDDVHYLIGYRGSDTELVLPDSYYGAKYKIYNYAFYNSSKLTSITLSTTVASIYGQAFMNCTGLTSVHFTGTMAQWKAMDRYYGWNTNTGDYTVHCTDGDITK